MSALRLPACTASLLLAFAAAASAQTVPAAPADSPAPTPFQGLGTLAVTPTPAPAATAAPTPAPVAFEKPSVQLAGAKVVDPRDRNNGVQLTFMPRARRVSTGYEGGTVPYMIQGTIHSFHPPEGGYTVQIIYLLNFSGEDPLIYAVGQYHANGSSDKLTFQAPNTGSINNVYALPKSRFNTANSPKVTDIIPVKLPDSAASATARYSPVAGYIVRIFAGTQLIYSDGSQMDFASAAKDNPGYFDKIFSAYTTPATPAPGQ